MSTRDKNKNMYLGSRVAVGLERDPLSLVKINEELLERKVAAPVEKTEINDRWGSATLTIRHPSIRKSWH
jgi:hypothetical protein